jgi:hypothetical protein
MSSPIYHVKYTDSTDAVCSSCQVKLERNALVLTTRANEQLQQHVGCFLDAAEQPQIVQIAGLAKLKLVSARDMQ